MPKLLDRPEFAAPSMCSEVDMEVFMLIRIRHQNKNYGTTQQIEISFVMPEQTPFSQVSYRAIKAMFGVLYGSI